MDGPRPGRSPASAPARIARLRPSRARTTSSPYLTTRTRRRAPETTTPDQPTRAPLPAAAQVYEDHDLSPAEQAAAWRDLVDWVAWLHDAYELGVEERLPPCWPDHPGLVRELAALRAWRAEIYTPPRHPGTGHLLPAWGNGGSARDWHTELRNVITTAATVYARTCRAGHKPPPTGPSGGSSTRETWLEQLPGLLLPHGHTPPADAPAASAPSEGSSASRRIDAATMRRHLADGRAVNAPAPLAGYTRHEGAWWVAGPDGTWLQITDPALAARLDTAHTLLDRAHRAGPGPTPRP